MKMEVSDKVAVPQKRPHIKKGFYHARLVEVKPKKTESKYGKKIVLLFEILNDAFKQNGKYLQLATEAYYEYKQDDGSYRTAVTPNSRITQIFQALGWKFTTQGLDTNDFIGAEAEVLVDDYEYEYTDPNTNKTEILKASTINDVNKWEDQPEVVEEVVE
ncbi:hypothetical protein DRJ17_00700 [Candidatus Woesearchaeota archaeon]|nr:MAG: hypothetical protein DRJ17_00700 [Candidatus Woesearchaeota archaeon]